jgi:hypothetical protein
MVQAWSHKEQHVFGIKLTLYVMICDLSPSYTTHKINMNYLFAVFSVPLQRVLLNITTEQKERNIQNEVMTFFLKNTAFSVLQNDT